MPDKDDKTEKATPKKLDEAREKGQIVESQETMNLILLGIAFLIIFSGRHFLIHSLNRNLILYLQDYMQMDLTMANAVFLLNTTFRAIAMILTPFLAAFCLISFVAGFFQAGGLKFSSKALEWKLSALNPISNFDKFFSAKSLMETGKAILKIAVISWFAYKIVQKQMYVVPYLSENDVTYALEWLAGILFAIFSRIVWIFILLAVIDFSFQKWKHGRDLKMSKQEVKDERKQSDGDPMMKSKIRSMQFEILRKNMASEVQSADVIITNPTHFAVALKFKPDENPAPIVTAKGVDFLAQKIKKLARQKEILIMENRPLARFLYYKVKLGHPVPEEIFETVAKVYAYLYQIKNRKI